MELNHVMLLCLRHAVTMVTECMCGYLGDEVYERLSSQLFDPLCVETGQIVGLRLPLCLTAAIESPVLYKIRDTKSCLNITTHYRREQVEKREEIKQKKELQEETATQVRRKTKTSLHS